MDRSQLERELERHYADVWTWALSCCRWDPTSAEDVLQEAFSRILGGQARHDGKSAFRTWLFGVVRIVALEYRRSWKRNEITTSSDGGNPGAGVSDSPNPDQETERAELSQRVQDALAILPRRQREVLELVFFRDHSLAEAAKIMGIREGTVSTHYKRGKRRLKRELSDVWSG